MLIDIKHKCFFPLCPSVIWTYLISIFLSSIFKVTMVVFKEFYIFAIIKDPFRTSFLSPYMRFRSLRRLWLAFRKRHILRYFEIAPPGQTIAFKHIDNFFKMISIYLNSLFRLKIDVEEMFKVSSIIFRGFNFI